jgi:hypothetical protein
VLLKTKCSLYLFGKQFERIIGFRHRKGPEAIQSAQLMKKVCSLPLSICCNKSGKARVSRYDRDDC